MKKTLGLILSSLIIICQHQSGVCQQRWLIKDQDKSCTTPHNREGTCIPLTQCQPILQLLQSRSSRGAVFSYLRRSVCRMQGSLPDMCCPAVLVDLDWSGWTPWAPWSQCSTRCGGGVRRRHRACTARTSCGGPSSEQQTCNSHPCRECLVHICRTCQLLKLNFPQPSMEGGASGPSGVCAAV